LPLITFSSVAVDAVTNFTADSELAIASFISQKSPTIGIANDGIDQFGVGQR
jgi:hypothetical protein